MFQLHIPSLHQNAALRHLFYFRANSHTTDTIAYILGIPFLSSLDGHKEPSALPSELIATVLGLIAHLTDCLAATLNLTLPHPLAPFDTYSAVISPAGDQR